MAMLSDHTTVTRVLDKMLHGYDKEVRPGTGGEFGLCVCLFVYLIHEDGM